MKRTLGIFLASMLALGTTAMALAPGEEVETRETATPAEFPSWTPTDLERTFLDYAALPEAPPMDYWLRLAQCETGQEWTNPGRHGGAVGFFTVGRFPSSGMGGWERMGGEEYADHPKDATPTEQVVIMVRTALLGWGPIPLQRDPEMARRKGVPVDYEWETGPHGYWTWGCAKRVVGDPCGLLYDGTTIPDLPHVRPDYCRFMKPKDYRKVDGNGRYVHNRDTARAIERSRAEGATSVAMPSAVEWLHPTPVSTAPIPESASCPRAWPYARQAGFTDDEIAILDGIITDRSGCRAHAKTTDRDGVIHRGWTLLPSTWTSYLRTAAILWSSQDLLDPMIHMEAVRALYERDLRRGGDGWGWAAD